MAQKFTKAEKINFLNEALISGLSLAEYARTKSIDPKKAYCWKEKYLQKPKEKFGEIKIQNNKASNSLNRNIDFKTDGIEIHLEKGCSIKFVNKVLEVLFSAS